MIVDYIALTKCPCGAVSQPRHPFVALRAVHRHSLIVAQNTSGGVFKYLAKY